MIWHGLPFTSANEFADTLSLVTHIGWSLSVSCISTDSCSLQTVDNTVINLLFASLQAKTVICGWVFYLYNWQTLDWTCHFFWHFIIEHIQMTLQFTVKCSCVSIVLCSYTTVKWPYTKVSSPPCVMVKCHCSSVPPPTQVSSNQMYQSQDKSSSNKATSSTPVLCHPQVPC